MRSPMFYKPSILRRILWAVGITLIVLAVIFLAYYCATLYFAREHKVPVNNQPTITPLEFELDPGVTYHNVASNNALFFYSTEHVKVVNAGGKLTEEISLKMAQPAALTKGNHTLFFDLSGRNAMAFNGTKQTTTITLEENILLGAVNASGYILLVSEGDLHKCSVRVFTPDGEEIFKWNSGNLSVVGADIADNSKDITISALNTDEDTVKNHIMMFNIAKEKPFTNDQYESSIYSVIRYSGGYLYCIGGNETLIYNGYGKCTGQVHYAEREFIQYTLSDDLLVLAFSGATDTAGAVAEIKTINHKGEETGSFACVQEFDFLVSKDGIIALNSGRTLSLLNNHCREKRQINLGFDLRDFIFFGGNGKGVGITAAGAEMIHLG